MNIENLSDVNINQNDVNKNIEIINKKGPDINKPDSVNMVIAISTNMRPPWTYAFIVSFLKEHPKDRLILLVDLKIETHLNFIEPLAEMYNFELVDFHLEGKATNYRWRVIYNYLSKQDLTNINHIMFSDVDVYFQKNVFNHIHSRGMYVFEEGKEVYSKIKDEQW
eukprot:UN29674